MKVAIDNQGTTLCLTIEDSKKNNNVSKVKTKPFVPHTHHFPCPVLNILTFILRDARIH